MVLSGDISSSSVSFIFLHFFTFCVDFQHDVMYSYNMIYNIFLYHFAL